MTGANRSRKSLLVFDFDGVIADSEAVANAVLADYITELGMPMGVDECLHTFMGKRMDDVASAVSEVLGRAVPDLAATLTARTLARFRTDLREVPGVRGYVAAFAGMKRAIASSSSPERLAGCLDILGLADVFPEHVYSASMVARGKPHPDLFLHAAARVGVAPEEAIVIEDSASGIRGAVAAGMTAIGFLGGSHVRDGHGERLRHAGAVAIARDYAELEGITRSLCLCAS
jgi:HAD superfamily hydrolase (TIGR01509 family)